MSKCIGCGSKLQNLDKNDIGYTSNIDNNLCERCFRIRNYNEYKFVVKDNSDFINILKNIDKTHDLVILVVDLFNISSNLDEISKYISNDIILVLTKRDIIPKSCYDENLKKYFNNYKLNILDTIVISSKNNYNLDNLYNKIFEYKKSNRVYVVGFTNSGKSTMINKIIYNYSQSDMVITTSNLPSTTIDSIEVNISDNLTLIDTPGILDDGDISNYVDGKTLKKIIPTKEIKPITYQINKNQVIIIDELVRLDLNDNNITIYMSNNLNINRYYKDVELLKNLERHELYVEKDNDVVVQGLGFIKFTNNGKVTLYTIKGVKVFIRTNLI